MKLLLADDHVLFRDALIQFILALRPEWEITTVSNFESAFEYLCSGNIYDLVLIDLRMPGMDGLEGLKKTLDHYPDQMAAILSGVAEEHHVKKAIELGARAYMPKTLSGKALVNAIELVVISGHKFIPMDESGTKIMPAYFDDYSEYTATESHSSHDDLRNKIFATLTKREKEVLHYLSQGLSNKEIAREMDIKIATVKLHVSGVCKKLNVTNRTQAAILAHNNGLSEMAHL